MLECEYCKRIFKKHHKTCPGCGSSIFKEIESTHELVIEKIPKGGYKLDLKNYQTEKKRSKAKLLIIIIIIIVIIATFLLPLTFVILSIDFSNIIFSLLFIIMLIIVFYKTYQVIQSVRNNNKEKENLKMEKLKRLSTNGILIKNLNYEIIPIKFDSNNNQIYAIKVVYTPKDGVERSFISEKKYNNQIYKEDGTVDLLIDPNDYKNYFIDFEIY